MGIQHIEKYHYQMISFDDLMIVINVFFFILKVSKKINLNSEIFFISS
jgi:hypothetical protein